MRLHHGKPLRGGESSARGVSRLRYAYACDTSGPGPAGPGTAEEIAQTILAALKGLKASAPDVASYRAGQARLARLFARALAP